MNDRPKLDLRCPNCEGSLAVISLTGGKITEVKGINIETNERHKVFSNTVCVGCGKSWQFTVEIKEY